MRIKIKIEAIGEHFTSEIQLIQQVWLIHPHDMWGFFFCGICSATGASYIRQMAPLQLHSMWYFSVNIHSEPAWFRRFFCFDPPEHRDFISQRLPWWTALVFFSKSVRHALNFSCLSSCRTQKMGFSWMWTTRCPWCAVSWLRTQSWREDIMLWASPRGHNFCM